MLGPRRFMGTGRGLDILWQHIMQIDYAHYPGMVGNDWSGAVQNPAYRLSVKNPPHGGFFISPIITQVTIYLYDFCLPTCHYGGWRTAIFPLVIARKGAQQSSLVSLRAIADGVAIQ